jgi:hypothetical protein
MTGLLSVFVLASVLAAPLAPSQCSKSNVTVKLFQADEGGGTDATCTAYCGELNPWVQCQYASSCSAVDANCPTERGYVICDGTTYYCNACCTNGQTRSVIAGPTCSCEEPGTTPRDRYLCVNGNWEYQYSFCGGPFCPVWP